VKAQHDRIAKTAVFASLVSFGLLSGANAGEPVSSDELAREAIDPDGVFDGFSVPQLVYRGFS